ncbi:UDP-3-O-(3-hydroxymyristoyl)glucosamine N-acyltransferase [Desulfatirhabdium butyrativorans]|uniref:UDP-3-O-(3-hydroxymyristoyl)glucosamine N-acyltransferase n=1 Tax=Desulfatirhabdium butyrativorans TaxID=340467 RepID=UPI0003F797FA|nr:UDP-3-O-(3-hydroxymyristoyl)glucosamine N-acyltransferase [Desulfatirhabdium butyrativorans]
MNHRLAELAEMLGGTLCGDGDVPICGVAAFEIAGPGEITFAGSPKFYKIWDQCRAGAVLVPKNAPENLSGNLVRVENPQLAFNRLVRVFYPKTPAWNGISPSAHIAGSAAIGTSSALAPFVTIGERVRIGERTVIHPHVCIGNDVIIGDDVEIFPNVTILDGTRIGHRVVLQAGTVIGSDGFGYVREGDEYHKIPHLGHVQIDDDVEIGSCNTIDRATFGKTWIQKGVKTDNLVHIAHNVTVGENSIIVAQVGISGSVRIGKNVILAGQAGVSGHLNIGDRAIVGPQAGIAASVEAGAVVSGSPEMPHSQWLRVQRTVPKLPEIAKRLAQLEKRFSALEPPQPTNPPPD